MKPLSSPRFPLRRALMDGLAGTVWAGVLFLVGVQGALTYRSFLGSAIDPWFWKATDCVILESSVRHHSGPAQDRAGSWETAVRYRYTAPGTGEPITAVRVTVDSPGSVRTSDAGEAQRIARRYRTESHARCYVNPRADTESVLVREPPWQALGFLVPLTFVILGLSALAKAWVRKRPADLTPPPPAQGPLGLVFLVVFFGSAGIGGLLLVQPALRIFDARHWDVLPCTIVSSSLTDGDSAQIHFRYRVMDEVFDGSTADFFQFATASGRRGLVRRFSTGSEATCYVNPHDPTDAVLDRGNPLFLWWALIPGGLCVAALFGLVFAGRILRSERDRTGPTRESARVALRGSRTLPTEFRDRSTAFLLGFDIVRRLMESATEHARSASESARAAEQNSRILEAEPPDLSNIFFLLVFGLFFLSVIPLAITGTEDPPWLIMVPFGSIGVAALGGAVYQILRLSNPRSMLSVNHRALPLGGEFEVAWAFRGGLRRMRRLRISLRGREEATSISGDGTTTDRHTFADLDLFNGGDPATFASGQASGSIPADSVPTFLAPNNKIVWSVHVYGKIPCWPAVNEDFPITVLPRAHAASSSQSSGVRCVPAPRAA